MHIFETSIFGIQIAPTWYGLMYAIGFSICYFFMRKTVKFQRDDLDTLLLWIFFGVILGGRIGYIVLYNLGYFIENPIEIFSIWKGGMSFHGGCIGVIIALFLFSKWKKYSFWQIADHLAVIVPVALGLGRIGNYINHELPGYAPYHGPFAMDIHGVSHFPNPLLEMLLEGVILFAMMYLAWKYISKSKNIHLKNAGILSALFLVGYSIARLISEQYRLPDIQIGYIWGTDWITLGILYTLPLLILGVSILVMKLNIKKHTITE